MASPSSGLLGIDKHDKSENSYFNGLLVAFRFGFIHKNMDRVPRTLVSALPSELLPLVSEVPTRAVTCAERAPERPDPTEQLSRAFPALLAFILFYFFY